MLKNMSNHPSHMEIGCSSKFTRNQLWYPNLLSKHHTLQRVPCLNQFLKLPIHIRRFEICRCKVNAMSSNQFDLSSLMALSPLDGRYWNKVQDLAPIMSEFGLNHFRILVEIKWLLKLSQISEIIEVPCISKKAECYLLEMIDKFCQIDALEIKQIEKVTNHDVKAVEYFLKKRCESHPEITKVLEFFHFACTSEDINNLAYALMLRETVNVIILPVIDDLIAAISQIAKNNAHIPVPPRIHGLEFSTTLGKEIRVFSIRLKKAKQGISQLKMMGKFAGAVGNYNSHIVSYPHVNWPQIAEEFVTSFGINFNPYVTQIESHDYMAELFDAVFAFNNILIDFNRCIWSYVSSGYFTQSTKAGEVGSSTMPHKVNPIDFENSEGNLGVANGGLFHLKNKLPNSRWQRDLTDSTVLRSMGEVFGRSFLSYQIALQGISKLQVNEFRLNEDYQAWNLLIEADSRMPRRRPIDSTRFSVTALLRSDDPYYIAVKDLASLLSEYGLIHCRLLVEIKWLLMLSQIPEVREVPSFSNEAKLYLQGLIDDFSMKDAVEVKNIEKMTNHDVNTVMYFIKNRCNSYPEIAKVLELYPFGCTCKEINNLAHALMLSESMNRVVFPVIDELIMAISDFAKNTAHIPMLSRTHGQTASPTTLGKEMAIFATRLCIEKQNISKVKLMGRFGGALGDYDSHIAAHPHVNWHQIAEEFVISLGLTFNPDVTQIEVRDYMAELLRPVIRFNNILNTFNVNISGYLSLGYFRQIVLENGEGNIGVANGGLSHLCNVLSLSTWQSDLSDSTILRCMFGGLGESLLSYKRASVQILMLEANEARLDEDLNKSWEVLAEAIQTVMRKYGVSKPYERLKDLTRGREVSRESLREFIQGLEVPEEAKCGLLELTPQTYIGAAPHLAAAAVDFVENQILKG